MTVFTQTQDDPFVSLVQGMLQTGTAVTRLCTGVVSAAAPLTVQAEGLALTGRDLCVSASLLARTLRGTVDGKAASISMPGELGAGDRVLLLTVDGQTYYILCKAVSL